MLHILDSMLNNNESLIEAFQIRVGRSLALAVHTANREWSIPQPKWYFLYQSVFVLGLDQVEEFALVLTKYFKKNKLTANFASELLNICTDSIIYDELDIGYTYLYACEELERLNKLQGEH